MLNRREFVQAAAGTAMFTRITGAFPSAASYDLIVRGGRVIDPSLRVDAVRDVAIAGGRIAAVEPDIKAEATNTIDARGKIVVPGLLDIHTHAARAKDGPAICLADGVTGFIDAGSQGAERIDEVVAIAIGAAAGRVLINIGRTGILPDGDTMDLSRADVGARASRDRTAPRHHRRRQGAAVAGGRRRQRLRSAAARAGNRRPVQSARDDSHGSDDVAAGAPVRLAQAG